MSEVILYTTDDGKTKIDLQLKDGTVWLSQLQIADLFQTSKQNISKHIQTIFEDQELDEKATVNQQLTVQKEGSREVERTLTPYATATGYHPKSEESLQFFKIVQNKLHYAAHGHTASEVIYLRVDSDQPFAGLSNFKGSQPTQAEAMIAFDLAEINAIEEREHMSDDVRELDSSLCSTGRKLLDNAGKISSTQAKRELQKYKALNLDAVEKDYLKTISSLEQQAKKESRKKGGQA